MRQASVFLIVSSGFHTLAAAAYNPSAETILTGGIYFINAAGMPIIACAVGYLLMRVIRIKAATFRVLLCVYFFSSSVTLIVSWIPATIFFAETWRWWLIGVGITKALRVSGWRAFIIIGLSIVIIVLSFLGFNRLWA